MNIRFGSWIALFVGGSLLQLAFVNCGKPSREQAAEYPATVDSTEAHSTGGNSASTPLSVQGLPEVNAERNPGSETGPEPAPTVLSSQGENAATSNDINTNYATQFSETQFTRANGPVKFYNRFIGPLVHPDQAEEALYRNFKGSLLLVEDKNFICVNYDYHHPYNGNYKFTANSNCYSLNYQETKIQVMPPTARASATGALFTYPNLKSSFKSASGARCFHQFIGQTYGKLHYELEAKVICEAPVINNAVLAEINAVYGAFKGGTKSFTFRIDTDVYASGTATFSDLKYVCQPGFDVQIPTIKSRAGVQYITCTSKLVVDLKI